MFINQLCSPRVVKEGSWHLQERPCRMPTWLVGVSFIVGPAVIFTWYRNPPTLPTQKFTLKLVFRPPLFSFQKCLQIPHSFANQMLAHALTQNSASTVCPPGEQRSQVKPATLCLATLGVLNSADLRETTVTTFLIWARQTDRLLSCPLYYAWRDQGHLEATWLHVWIFFSSFLRSCVDLCVPHWAPNVVGLPHWDHQPLNNDIEAYC